MSLRWFWVLAVLAAAAGGSVAQEVLYIDPHLRGAAAAGHVLSPVDTPVVAGDAPLFLDPAQVVTRGPRLAPRAAPPVVGEAVVDAASVGGTVGPAAVFDAGALPPVFPRDLRVDIGFQYLRPDFPGRSVRLVVPGGVNGNVTAIAGSGDVSYDFGFIPAVRVDYQFSDLGFGVGASGKLTSLSGHLTRTVDTAAGAANLTASATVNVAVANLIEGTLDLPLRQYDCFRDTCLQNTVLFATLGTRYSHLSQDYTASLNSGASGSTVTAHQDWNGFGLTASLSGMHPLPGDFFLYGVSRGSCLVGTNNRTSNLAVVVAGDAAASGFAKATENRTMLVPVGEFELGIAWGRVLGRPPIEGVRMVQTAPALWIKAGVVVDVWGGLGPLSAADSPNGFSGSRLLLYGFSVLAGLDY